MRALPVSALVSFVRDLLEANEILSDVWVVGEVSNWTRSQAGHRYFSLKDDQARIDCVLFRTSMPNVTLKNGDRVFAHGRVTVYAQQGRLQLVCDFVRPEGIGLEAAKLEELRLRLEREGLFDQARKRPLPAFPRRIGVITSATGAAIQDITRVLRSRWPLAELILAPTFVQGDLAVPNLLAAMRDLARVPGLDFAIIARGGGAAEDLAAFNDERIARAIFAYPVPVVTGLGHERDRTIADLVADLWAPTPSAAVERSTPDIREVGRRIRQMESLMRASVRHHLARDARRVTAGSHRLRAAAPRIDRAAAEVAALVHGIREQMLGTVARQRTAVESLAARVDSMNPHAVLARGYAIVERRSRTPAVVRSVTAVIPGDELSVGVADGTFRAEVVP